MINSDPMGPLGFNARRRPGSGLLAPFFWAAGLIATALAVAVGALLAVFTAAAVALIAVVAPMAGAFALPRRRIGRRTSPSSWLGFWPSWRPFNRPSMPPMRVAARSPWPI
jgi:hypothetical protein